MTSRISSFERTLFKSPKRKPKIRLFNRSDLFVDTKKKVFYVFCIFFDARKSKTWSHTSLDPFNPFMFRNLPQILNRRDWAAFGDEFLRTDSTGNLHLDLKFVKRSRIHSINYPNMSLLIQMGLYQRSPDLRRKIWRQRPLFECKESRKQKNWRNAVSKHLPGRELQGKHTKQPR